MCIRDSSYIQTYCATDLRGGKIRNMAAIVLFLYRVCDFKHLPLLMKNLILLPLLASLVCASFISVSAQETAGVVPIKASVNDSAASAPDRPLTEIYRVGVGDTLDIRLLNSANSKSSTLFTVVAGGVIDLPIAGGTISVAGLTPEEIQTIISAELKRRAVDDKAQVSVGAVSYTHLTL